MACGLMVIWWETRARKTAGTFQIDIARQFLGWSMQSASVSLELGIAQCLVLRFQATQ